MDGVDTLAELSVLHNRICEAARTLNDGASRHLSGNLFHQITALPINVPTLLLSSDSMRLRNADFIVAPMIGTLRMIDWRRVAGINRRR
jgi:hypothetical protein